MYVTQKYRFVIRYIATVVSGIVWGIIACETSVNIVIQLVTYCVHKNLGNGAIFSLGNRNFAMLLLSLFQFEDLHKIVNAKCLPMELSVAFVEEFYFVIKNETIWRRISKRRILLCIWVKLVEKFFEVNIVITMS